MSTTSHTADAGQNSAKLKLVESDRDWLQKSNDELRRDLAGIERERDTLREECEMHSQARASMQASLKVAADIHDTLRAENERLIDALLSIRMSLNAEMNELSNKMSASDAPEVAAQRNADQLVLRYDWSRQFRNARELLGVIFPAICRNDRALAALTKESEAHA